MCYTEAPKRCGAEEELAPKYGTNGANTHAHKQPCEVGTLDLESTHVSNKKWSLGGFLAFLWEIKKGNSNYNFRDNDSPDWSRLGATAAAAAAAEPLQEILGF